LESIVTINDPAVLAELHALHDGYEAALMSNNVEKLSAFFWSTPEALRFGVSESLYGADEIDAFRKARSAVDLAREVDNLKIVAFGNGFGTITLEFQRRSAGMLRHGRQTQVWVRFPEGWKIVSAHVSFTPSSTMDSAAAWLGLPIPVEFSEGVRLNLERSGDIAAPLLRFALPEETESAQVFQP
jgi:hypothetical protein